MIKQVALALVFSIAASSWAISADSTTATSPYDPPSYIVAPTANATAAVTPSVTVNQPSRKLSANLSNLIFLGDLSLKYEGAINEPNFAYIIGAHVSMDSSHWDDTGKFGGSAGLRFYGAKDATQPTLSGPFVQALFKVNQERNSSSSGIELWGGISQQFSKDFFYELGAGLSRKFISSSDIGVLFSADAGMRF